MAAEDEEKRDSDYSDADSTETEKEEEEDGGELPRYEMRPRISPQTIVIIDDDDEVVIIEEDKEQKEEPQPQPRPRSLPSVAELLRPAAAEESPIPAQRIARIDGLELSLKAGLKVCQLLEFVKNSSDKYKGGMYESREAVALVTYHISTLDLCNFVLVGHSVDQSTFDAVRTRATSIFGTIPYTVPLSGTIPYTMPVVSICDGAILMNGGCEAISKSCHRCHALRGIALQCPRTDAHRLCRTCMAILYGSDVPPPGHFRRCAVCSGFCNCAVCNRRAEPKNKTEEPCPKFFSFGEATREYLVVCPESAAPSIFGPSEDETKQNVRESKDEKEKKRHHHHHHHHHRRKSDAVAGLLPSAGIFGNFFGDGVGKPRKRKRDLSKIDTELPARIEKLRKTTAASSVPDAVASIESRLKKLRKLTAESRASSSSFLHPPPVPKAPNFDIPSVIETSERNFSYDKRSGMPPWDCLGVFDHTRWSVMNDKTKDAVITIMNVLGVSWRHAHVAYGNNGCSIDRAIDVLLPRVKTTEDANSAKLPGTEVSAPVPAKIGAELPGCSICLEPFASVKELVSTDCGHMYCNKCIRDWLRIHPGCPKCRSPTTIAKLRKLFA